MLYRGIIGALLPSPSAVLSVDAQEIIGDVQYPPVSFYHKIFILSPSRKKTTSVKFNTMDRVTIGGFVGFFVQFT